MRKKELHQKILYAFFALAGSSLVPHIAEAATELTDQTYTNSIGSITYGDFTVNNGDVTLDASGYTGAFNSQRAVINTINGAVNINIAEGNSLTIKGFNNHTNQRSSALYAYKRGVLSGDMIFTGGDITVSNEVSGSYSIVYGMVAENGGKFDFRSDGDNKVNLTVLMPEIGGLRSTHRVGIGLYNGNLAFDGGSFTIQVLGDPDPNSINERTGMSVSSGSTVDVKADQIWIETSDTALQTSSWFGGGLPPTSDEANRIKFDADLIVLKGHQGILAGGTPGNTIEFTGETHIEAISNEGDDNIFGYLYGGKAIEATKTDFTFNGKTTVIGENLSNLGTQPGYMQDPGGRFER